MKITSFFSEWSGNRSDAASNWGVPGNRGIGCGPGRLPVPRFTDATGDDDSPSAMTTPLAGNYV